MSVRTWILLGIAVVSSALMPHAMADEKCKHQAEVNDDPAARQLLKAAHELRHVWRNFPGFAARLTFTEDEKTLQGEVIVTLQEVRVTLPDSGAEKKVTEMLRSLVAHRSPVPFEQSAGKYPIAFGDADDHPMGRLVRLGDPFRSAYRIKDGHIRQVIRHLGDTTMIITVLEETKTDEGWLPKHFTVAWWSKDGTLQRVETFTDRYVKVGNFWLPAERRVLTASKGGLTVTILRLDEHRLLNAERAVR
ncbi:MAG: hypothetical protein SLRJCFUN_001680 [Candidatus Fervidibacter sp.]